MRENPFKKEDTNRKKNRKKNLKREILREIPLTIKIP